MDYFDSHIKYDRFYVLGVDNIKFLKQPTIIKKKIPIPQKSSHPNPKIYTYLNISLGKYTKFYIVK